MMTFFPEIDRKKTKQSVKKLLEHYRSLERLAGEEYIPNVTTSYSFELKSFTGRVNRETENAVIRKADAESELEKIAKAMNKLNQSDRKLIYDKFMSKKELTTTAIYLDYSMSSSSFYRELEKVLIKFAEAYEGGTLLRKKQE